MRKTFLFTAFLIIANTLYSANIEDILVKMEEADSKVTDLSFSFKQEILITLTQETSIINGTAIFKKPDLFKIEHIKPEKQTVVSDGNKVFFYQQEFNQVMIEDWKSLSEKGSFPKGIFNFASAVSDLKKNYDISLLDEQEKFFIVLLKLKAKQQQDIKIKLWVSRENYMVEKTAIETENVISTVAISDIKINKKVKDSVFKFKIPKNAQIITSPF